MNTNYPNADRVSHMTGAERISVEGRAWQPRVVNGGAPRGAAPSGEPPRKKFVAKGHDSQLQDAQYGKHPIQITTQAGETIDGVISRRDKYTITVKLSAGNNQGKDLIVYKHAIESVLIDKAPAADNTDEG